MANEYESLRAGFEHRVMLQAIRKVVRSNDTDDLQKVKEIVSIVHSYEDDLEAAESAAERRAIEADEAEMTRQHIDEMFEGMAAPVMEALTLKGDAK